MKKLTKADKIRKALTDNPDQSKSALAKKVGASLPHVYEIAKQMKPKKIVLTASEVAVANRLGVDTKTFAETKAKMDKDGVRRHPSGRIRMQGVNIDANTPKADWKQEAVVTSNESVKQATNTDALLAERGSRYGTFMGHARVTQVLKNVLSSHAKSVGNEFNWNQAEALDMIAHKLGRIVNGDPNYVDSWRDIEGYAKLVADFLETGKDV